MYESLNLLHDTACSQTLIMCSWVISTSFPGSKESSTRLTGECTNALCIFEEMDQLPDRKMFYLL